MSGGPVELALLGAGLGAATSEDPLKGAALGGLGGWAGGTFLGPMMGATPGATGASLGFGGNGVGAASLGGGGYGSLGAVDLGFGAMDVAPLGFGATAPGLSSAAELGFNGVNAGMSAMPMSEYGVSQLSKPGFFDRISSTASRLGDNKALKAGMMLNNNNQQQQRPAPVFAQAPRFEGQNATVRPYQPGVVGPNPEQAMMQFDGYMPGYNKYSPY